MAVEATELGSRRACGAGACDRSSARVRWIAGAACCALVLGLAGCGAPAAEAADPGAQEGLEQSQEDLAQEDLAQVEPVPDEGTKDDATAQDDATDSSPADDFGQPDSAETSVALEPTGALEVPGYAVTYDVRESFLHGPKPASVQKYIMLHDTEGDSSAASVVDWWDGNGAGVAAHFIVDRQGGILQCVPLEQIAHHAGFGDTGHNALYGVEDESRDDKVGTQPIGDWASDYGMNSHSIGIELVHVGGSGAYPQAQLDALDALIAALDDAYGFEAPIIDHKAWRTGNSDTSPEFAEHLASYQTSRKHA